MTDARRALGFGAMNITGLTSVIAGPTTAALIKDLRGWGVEPVIVTHRANSHHLKSALNREDYANAIVVSSFRNPKAAANELARTISQRGLHFTNWINITDDTSAFFLHSCKRIGFEFAFQKTYERCRVKPITRQVLAKAGLCDTKFDVHNIDDPRPPRRFLFPFIAKPILGTGSKGVSVINGPNHWRKYLKTARSLLKPDDVSIANFAPGRQVLVEEVLTGQECQLDGFVDANAVEFCALGMKIAAYGIHGYREERGILYRPLTLKNSRTHDLRLMEWCEHVLDALQFECGTFHIEVKVNGPDIHLLEVNPRPGGGANVATIKLLSGVDLNQECLRLWAGLPRIPPQDPKHFSICFAVRYPSIIGRVESIRKGGTLSRLRTSTDTSLEWYPLVAKDDRLDPRQREQYLGVLTAPDFCNALEEMDPATQELVNFVHGRSFVREKSN